jgi:hypothetical protein
MMPPICTMPMVYDDRMISINIVWTSNDFYRVLIKGGPDIKDSVVENGFAKSILPVVDSTTNCQSRSQDLYIA